MKLPEYIDTTVGGGILVNSKSMREEFILLSKFIWTRLMDEEIQELFGDCPEESLSAEISMTLLAYSVKKYVASDRISGKVALLEQIIDNAGDDSDVPE